MAEAERTFPPESVVERCPEVAYEILDGEAVLFHEGTGEVHVLNHTATFIWQAFDGESRVSDVVAHLSRLAGVSYPVIEADVLATLQDFRNLGLVRAFP